jgi:hypothetical protein
MFATVFGPDLGIVLVVLIFFVGLPIWVWGLIDAHHPTRLGLRPCPFQ